MTEISPARYRVETLESLDTLAPDTWDDFVARSPWGHVLQTCRWGHLKEQFGWQAVRLALTEQQAVVGVAQLLLRRLPLGLSIAYLPRGPVVPPHDYAAREQLIARAIAVARENRAIFLKVEPSWSETEDQPDWWRAQGMRPASTVQPRSTILVDLSGPEEEWLQRMKQKTRYNIRLAARKGVEVREGTYDDLRHFHELMVVTGQRDRFAIRDLAYYQKAWEALAPAGMATLLLATYEGELLAGLMPFACGQTAWYMYGASSNRHRNRMPNHALQWAAMRWAKARGCTTYDLWGIPDDAGGTSGASRSGRDELWGVYRFKKGFGGTVFRTVGAYDAVLSAPLYWAYRRVQTSRRRRPRG
jgi:lipid II:glycine glycyltransferase (peptidoglycan interpeptide bridge formation enzyme)